MARLMARPDPTGEKCPFCGRTGTLETAKSYAVSIGVDQWRNADQIQCNKCRKGFWYGWESVQPDGIWPNPIGYE